MGNSVSTIEGVGGSDHLKRFCSSEIVCENDPFWNALLSYSLVDLDLVAISQSNSRLLEDSAKSLCKNLSINNVKTGNFHTLVKYFVNRLDGVVSHGISNDSTNPFIWQVMNALYIIRMICKHFIQHLSEEVIIQQFIKPASSESTPSSSPDTTISSFVDALVRGVAEVPVHETTILLHLEIVNTLLTLLATVMYDSESATHNIFYVEIMEGAASSRASLLTQVLLTIYSHTNRLPSFVYKEDEAGSLSSTLWSVMTLGMAGSASNQVKRVNIGQQCALLLLVLANHPNTENPYRVALSQYNSEHEACLVKPEVSHSTLMYGLCALSYIRIPFLPGFVRNAVQRSRE